MKFLVKTNTQADQRDLVKGGYNIPNSTITWLSLVYVIITILANSLSNFISNTPQRNLEYKIFELKNQNFQIQILQRVLEIDNDDDRKLSLQLLLKAGLLRDNNNLFDFIEKSQQIPKWPERTLENLNSYISIQDNNYLPSSVNFPNAGLGNTNNTPPGNVNNTTPTKSGVSVPRFSADSLHKSVN